MRSAFILAAVAAVATAQTSAAGFSNVQADFKTLVTDLSHLQSALNAACDSCQYTNAQLVAVADGVESVGWAQGNATQATSGSAVFTSAQSIQLEKFIAKEVFPGITAVLDSLKAHEPGFAAQGIASQVSQNIAGQQTQAAQLCGALNTKVYGAHGTSTAVAYSKSIQSAFQTALAAY